MSRFFVFLASLLLLTILIDSRARADMTKKGQGVAVIAIGAAHDDASALARAVYGSALRPRSLDEVRARTLIGDRPPPYAAKDVKELAELRTSLTGEDVATKRLLGSLGQQLEVEAFLVVTTSSTSELVEDAGSALGANKPVARLFLVESGDFDAARYEPETEGWGPTVASLVQQKRFTAYAASPASPQAAPAPAAPKMAPQKSESSKPFWTSPWLWGAVGAAVLIGGFFFFASQDTEADPITVRMRVPR